MFLLLFLLVNVLLKVVLAFSLGGLSELGKLGSSVAQVGQNVNNDILSLPVTPTLRIPGLSGLKFDPLSLKDVVDFVPGWGMFNLGTEVHKVIFTLHNKKNNYVGEVLQPSDLRTFTESSWDPDQKLIVVIHGYTEDGSNSPLSATKKIVTAYAEANRPENIIFVDWHDLSRQVNYFRSANNTEIVGLYVAELLIFLRNSEYVKSFSDIHIVGFSLGAHVSGIGGYYAGEFLNEKIRRITGLDPAGPGFRDVSPESRLDPGDASFVDVIHTNMGPLLTDFGTMLESGHVDFYPNGGEHQPGCSLKVVGEVIGLCSHIKAPEYFSNTILGKVYLGFPCEDYSTYLKGGACVRDRSVPMGEFTDPLAKGKYYLTIPLE